MTITDFLEIERKAKVDEVFVDGDIPLWRICRRSIRIKYLGIVTKTSKPNIHYISVTINIFKSLCQLIYLLLFVKKDYVFFPHSRLYNIKGSFIDKLTDPLIDSVPEINKSYCILQNPQNGQQHYPRYHHKNTYNLDFIVFVVILFSPILRKYYLHKFSNEINEVLSRLSPYLDSHDYRNIIAKDITDFFINYKIYSIIIQALSPKTIFVIPREVFSAVIVYCKRHGIKTMEIEHGITMTNNELYSGVYNSLYDVDYFLTFGEASNNSCFGMPLDRIQNIGFAYKHWLSTKVSTNDSNINNTVLLLSEPHISDIIVLITIELARRYHTLNFCIRCHPQEKLSMRHVEMISDYDNISIADNSIEALYSFYSYDTILGENSSSVYEAASLGKRVGRLNFSGLKAININPRIYGGEYLNSIDDFEEFMNYTPQRNQFKQSAYSDFCKETLLQLI